MGEGCLSFRQRGGDGETDYKSERDKKFVTICEHIFCICVCSFMAFQSKKHCFLEGVWEEKIQLQDTGRQTKCIYLKGKSYFAHQ